jgi:hypothetical protein
MSVYVGIDVHRKRFQVAVVNEGGELSGTGNVQSGRMPVVARSCPDSAETGIGVTSRAAVWVLASLVVAEPGLSSHGDGLSSVLHLKFGEDVGDVIGDGLGAESEAAGDLDVARSAGDEREDLSFAVG